MDLFSLINYVLGPWRDLKGVVFQSPFKCHRISSNDDDDDDGKGFSECDRGSTAINYNSQYNLCPPSRTRTNALAKDLCVTHVPRDLIQSGNILASHRCMRFFKKSLSADIPLVTNTAFLITPKGDKIIANPFVLRLHFKRSHRPPRLRSISSIP